jgi:hypothetical protein
MYKLAAAMKGGEDGEKSTDKRMRMMLGLDDALMML